MKKLFICISIAFFISCIVGNKNQISSNNKDTLTSKLSFYRNILSDFRVSGYFLCINVKCNGSQSNQIVIENGTFYDILKKSDKILTEVSYQNNLIKNITTKEPFFVNCNTLELLKTYKVKPDEELMNMNIAQIKSRYFKGNVMVAGLNYEFKKRLILKLFENDIFVYRDDESGCLFYRQIK